MKYLNAIATGIACTLLATGASSGAYASITVKDNAKGTTIQLSTSTTAVATFDDASLLASVSLPRNPYSNGKKNYVLRVYHNCETQPALVDGKIVAARTTKQYAVSLDGLIKDKSAEFDPIRHVVLSEDFNPLPGICRLRSKTTYKDINGQKTWQTLSYKVEFTRSAAQQEAARCAIPTGVKSPDLDNNGTVTPTDAIYVVNRIGKADLSADLNKDGKITNADADLVNSRLGCTYPIDKCAVPAKYKSPDIDNNGTVTPTDAMYVINREGKNDLSADINNDSIVTGLDARIVSERLGCEYSK